MWWQVLLGVVAALVLVYAAMLLTLWRLYRHQPDSDVLRTALRLLPDLVRLLRMLAADPTLPRGVRIRLALLTGYLVFPLDLVPDFIPVLGYADDAITVALALRSVVRRAGPDALRRHWTARPKGSTSSAGWRASARTTEASCRPGDSRDGVVRPRPLGDTRRRTTHERRSVAAEQIPGNRGGPSFGPVAERADGRIILAAGRPEQADGRR